jgi:GR25 family glycosyltransferase involved in LPS biosynthesis
MNLLISGELRTKLAHQIRVALRHLDGTRKMKAFSSHMEHNSIGRIYVINLDRKPKRWKFVRKELDRFRSGENQSLITLTRRFSAVDARYLSAAPPSDVLNPTFTLAEQLAVHPDPLLITDDSARTHTISMTKPEIAIALSHIEVWKLIANGEAEFVMVLEDDIMMRPGFAKKLNKEWPILLAKKAELIYLSFKDVSGVMWSDLKSVHRWTKPGLWEASGYVLSRGAAQKLLDSLPANGPIDLWMNFRFRDLRTFTTSTQLIEQRLAEPSTNSYSVLPVLSQVGSVIHEKPLVLKAKRMLKPVIAIGSEGSGLTSLAVALSTLGYSVANDLADFPNKELAQLQEHKRGAAFDAFVNVSEFNDTLLARVMTNKNALLIITDQRKLPAGIPHARTLRLLRETFDKWGHLSRFLKVDYPSFPYPTDPDIGQRQLKVVAGRNANATHADLKWDRSPWIMPASRLPGGLPLTPVNTPRVEIAKWHKGDSLVEDIWLLRKDTFPSNMAIFQPSNVKVDKAIELTLKTQKSLVREFSGAAIATREHALYGLFGASLRPARGSGVITGLFLHRSGPRQEIDIEFLGKDTTKMLINVFYNPGAEGSKLEYGYRGTPTEIQLGFDAADEFHYYEIEWRPDSITWKIDGVNMYQRRQWEPTPIPDRPLEFNINIWTSRSIEFAGPLESDALPAIASVLDISIQS